MEKVKGQIKFDYDRKADVLYAFIDRPRPASTFEPESGIVIRYDSDAKQIVGVTVIDYMARRNLGILSSIPYFEDVEFPANPD